MQPTVLQRKVTLRLTNGVSRLWTEGRDCRRGCNALFFGCRVQGFAALRSVHANEGDIKSCKEYITDPTPKSSPTPSRGYDKDANNHLISGTNATVTSDVEHDQANRVSELDTVADSLPVNTLPVGKPITTVLTSSQEGVQRGTSEQTRSKAAELEHFLHAEERNGSANNGPTEGTDLQPTGMVEIVSTTISSIVENVVGNSEDNLEYSNKPASRPMEMLLSQFNSLSSGDETVLVDGNTHILLPAAQEQEHPVLTPSARPRGGTIRGWDDFWGKILYKYYNWRQDTTNDLQLFVLAFVAMVVFSSVVRGLVVEARPDGQMTDFLEDLYHVIVLSFGEEFPEVSTGYTSQLFSVVVAGSGLAAFALVLALVEQVVLEVVEENVRKGGRVYEKEHTLILGWCYSQRDLEVVWKALQQLCLAYRNEGGTTIVVLTKRAKLDLEVLFRRAIPEAKRYGSRFVFRQGSPLLPADLMQVSASEAAGIIVVSDQSRNPDEADAQSLRCAILLDELDEIARDPGQRAAHVVVEMKTTNAIPLLRYACTKRVMPVPTAQLNARRLAKMVKHPVISVVSQQIMNFENSSNMYIHAMPACTGLQFRDLAYRFPSAIVMGVVQAHGPVVLNPAGDYLVQPSDELIFMRPTSMSYRDFRALDMPVYVPPQDHWLEPHGPSSPIKLACMDGSEPLWRAKPVPAPGVMVWDQATGEMVKAQGAAKAGLTSREDSHHSNGGGRHARHNSARASRHQGASGSENEGVGQAGRATNRSSNGRGSSPGGGAGQGTSTTSPRSYPAQGKVHSHYEARPSHSLLHSKHRGSQRGDDGEAGPIPHSSAPTSPQGSGSATLGGSGPPRTTPRRRSGSSTATPPAVQPNEPGSGLPHTSPMGLVGSMLLNKEAAPAGGLQNNMIYMVPMEYLVTDEDAQTLLVCGWAEQSFMRNLIRELDHGASALPYGSEIVFCNLHETATSLGAALKTLGAPLVNCTVSHVRADPLQRRELIAMDAKQFKCAIVLCDERWVDPDMDASNGVDELEQMDMLRLDSLVMTVQLNVRKILEDLDRPTINIICQKVATEGLTRFEDRRRLPLGISVNFTSYAAKLLTQVLYNPKTLLPYSKYGEVADLNMCDASDLADVGELLNFWELTSRAQMKNQVLLGYYKLPTTLESPLETIMNPVSGREIPRVWNTGDSSLKFLVLSNKHTLVSRSLSGASSYGISSEDESAAVNVPPKQAKWVLMRSKSGKEQFIADATSSAAASTDTATTDNAADITHSRTDSVQVAAVVAVEVASSAIGGSSAAAKKKAGRN